jgi:hypothetical protein
MSSNTANTLNAIKGINSTFTGKGLTNLTGKGIVTSTPKRNHLLSEKQKEGIQKMITLFGSMNYNDRVLTFCIGTHSDGSPHLIALKGLAINRHLYGVMDFGVYGDDGRGILNGMRELYLKERSEGGLVKKW